MDVLIAHPYVWPEVRRGAERYVRDLTAFLRGRGHQAGVLTTWDDRNGPPPHGAFEFRGRKLSGWLTKIGVDPLVAFAPTMAWPLLRARADIIHALSPGDGVAAVLAKRRRRRVVTTLMGIPERHFNERTRSGARAWKLLLEQADRVICLSTFAAAALEREYGRKGSVIPPGVDTSLFRPVGERLDPPTILFVGALDEPRKRLGLLLEAFERIAGAHPDLRIMATGHGDPSTALRDRARLPSELRERVRVEDLSSEELPAAYSGAAVTLLPSRSEAFGLTLAESLACGTPVVGTDECGIVDVIDDPSIGRRFAPDDPDELAGAILEALGLAEEPGIRERCRRAALRFDWTARVGPAIESVYRELVP